MTEEKLGKVKHYFGRIGVAIVLCEEDGLSIGDTIHIKGATTDFTMTVDSMQVEHKPLTAVEKGKDVAIKVPDKVRQDDIVYIIK